MDQLDITREIIYLFLSVGAFAAGIIKPYIEDIAVPGQKLGQLIAEIIIVLRSSIIFGISVPGRKIETKFNAAPAAGLCCFFYNVTLERTVFYGMLCVFGRPQAETIMMLCRQHHSLHTCCLDGLHPLVTVQFGGIENGFRLISLSPFSVCKCIRTEMDECI